MTDTIAFLLDKSELDTKDLKLLKRLYKKGDIAQMILYERKILEVFWKICKIGQIVEVEDLDPKDAVTQLYIFN